MYFHFMPLRDRSDTHFCVKAHNRDGGCHPPSGFSDPPAITRRKLLDRKSHMTGRCGQARSTTKYWRTGHVTGGRGQEGGLDGASHTDSSQAAELQMPGYSTGSGEP